MIGVLRNGEDYPMTQTDNRLKRLPTDIGGLPAEPIQHVDLLRPRLRARAWLMTGDAARGHDCSRVKQLLSGRITNADAGFRWCQFRSRARLKIQFAPTSRVCLRREAQAWLTSQACASLSPIGKRRLKWDSFP